MAKNVIALTARRPRPFWAFQEALLLRLCRQLDEEQTAMVIELARKLLAKGNPPGQPLN